MGNYLWCLYFNVVEEMRQQETTEKRKYYQGLPVTSASLIFPTVYLLNYFLEPSVVAGVYGLITAIVAIAFVIDFKVIKPGLKGIMELAFVGLLIFIGLMCL